MSIYDYRDYKVFLRELIESFPKKGRGQARRLAEHLKVNSVVVSQILAGSRDFSSEQALPVAGFFGLDERATEYLVLLIQRARAGTKELENFYDRKIQTQRQANQDLKNRVVEHKELSDSDKGIFYSNWFYSGIRLLSSIEGFQSVDEIASYFGMSRAKVSEVVSFLTERGLCKEIKGKIHMGTTATYVDSTSKYVNSHRRNWRLKALERFTEPKESDLFYSSPYSLSEKDAEKIREELVKMISQISKKVGDSPAERLVCLNIDWFRF